jgi:hypothetical protein
LVRLIQSRDLPALLDAKALDKNFLHWAYNALDSAVTLRIHHQLSELLAKSEPASRAYSFTRSMQGPALAMMNRGVAIQQKVRADETLRYQAIRERAQRLLDTLANAVWGPEHYMVTEKTVETWTPVGKRGQPLQPRTRVVRTSTPAVRPLGLNAASSKQVLAFFNIALGLPVMYEIRKTAHGHERTPSANDKALLSWSKLLLRGPGIHPRDRSVPAVRLAAPFVSLILTIRDADKMLGVLRSPLDPDGRMRCSYNVAGTETGRWSSSKNVYGRGTNLQNITASMRRMFCADDGYRMISTDLEQAESRVVAGLIWAATGDDTYWRACESSDLHTQVVMMAYPELAWTSDPQSNRAIADQPCPDIPTYTYRDLAKRLGHGTNYWGSAFGIAQQVGVPVRIVEGFQRRYFSAFPGLTLWHNSIRDTLRATQYLITPLSRPRYFFSRPWEDSTLREAIAFVPQSTVADLLNRVMRATYLSSLTQPPAERIQLLLQNHDAFVCQAPLSRPLPSVIDHLNSHFLATDIPFTRAGVTRTMNIPGEFVTGFNWAYKAGDNPDGLTKWKGSDTRHRTEAARTTPADWLSRRL